MILYGNKLKELREENNISQNNIADKLGIIQSVYSHYETEYNIMPLKHLITIAKIFNVSLDYLFSFTNTKNYTLNNDYNIDIFKERLKKLRKDNKLTQTNLADFLNTTKSVISGYEVGRYLIATPFLYTICKKYNISADYLLGRIDNPKYFIKK